MLILMGYIRIDPLDVDAFVRDVQTISLSMKTVACSKEKRACAQIGSWLAKDCLKDQCLAIIMRSFRTAHFSDLVTAG